MCDYIQKLDLSLNVAPISVFTKNVLHVFGILQSRMVIGEALYSKIEIETFYRYHILPSGMNKYISLS